MKLIYGVKVLTRLHIAQHIAMQHVEPVVDIFYKTSGKSNHEFKK